MTDSVFLVASQPAAVITDSDLVLIGGYYGCPVYIVSSFFGGVHVSGSHPCWRQLMEEGFRGETLVYENLPSPIREAWVLFRMSAAENDALRKARLGVWRDSTGKNLLLVACLPEDGYTMIASYGPEATLDVDEMAKRLHAVYAEEPRGRRYGYRFEKKPRLPDGEAYLYWACLPLFGLLFSIGSRTKVDRAFSLTYLDYGLFLVLLVVIPALYFRKWWRRKRVVSPIRAALDSMLGRRNTT